MRDCAFGSLRLTRVRVLFFAKMVGAVGAFATYFDDVLVRGEPDLLDKTRACLEYPLDSMKI